MKRITIEDEHHLCLFALNNIAAGEEVLYTYGVKDLPWHKEVCFFFKIVYYILLFAGHWKKLTGIGLSLLATIFCLQTEIQLL